MPQQRSSRRDHHHQHRSRPAHRAEASRKRQQERDKRKKSSSRRPATSSDESRGDRSSQRLSANALADLNRENARQSSRRPAPPKRPNRAEYHETRQTPDSPRRPKKSKGKKRVVSGAIMEEGRVRSGLRGGLGRWSEESWEEKEYYERNSKTKKKSKKKFWIIGGVALVVIIIIIVVAVVVSKKKSSGSSSSSGGTSTSKKIDGLSHSEVPAQWQNTYLDPWTWASTTDFNVTFTDVMVGDLPVMGLYSTWDDSAQANPSVPALNKDWGSYSTRPARGVCLGGWLSLEPFIAPSLFNYNSDQGVIDEWTLSQHLGASAGSTIEQHYATFITEDDFKAIAAAGLDHVRIPYSYWAVEVFEGDPYVYRTSWRYLLRGIEWARKYGLRVNLDLHGIPGSQNGWNHSGRWGQIRWLNGTDGTTNGNRALDVHNRLSQFFAQDRYKNVISHYGLCNEPRMTYLQTDVVLNWTANAYNMVRKNGVSAYVVMGDGFMGLDNWKGLMAGYEDLVLDSHQYVIFNENQIDFTHQAKVQYACTDWTSQAEQSSSTATGFGPTIFAEWSQADTDCAQYLTNVGWGNRWEGTYNDIETPDDSVLSPHCPTKNSQCSCSGANADPSSWSAEYKAFLLDFAEAQMHSYEHSWGWWYWTWKTESAPQWSYQAGMSAGVLPTNAASRSFNCNGSVPDYGSNGLPETY